MDLWLASPGLIPFQRSPEVRALGTTACGIKLGCSDMVTGLPVKIGPLFHNGSIEEYFSDGPIFVSYSVMQFRAAII